jgi:hypothetical protein
MAIRIGSRPVRVGAVSSFDTALTKTVDGRSLPEGETPTDAIGISSARCLITRHSPPRSPTWIW